MSIAPFSVQSRLGKFHFSNHTRLFFIIAYLTCSTFLVADIAFRVLSPDDNRIPRKLLNIVHSIEGQREMGIPEKAQVAFDNILRKTDVEWMRIRVRPEAEQLPVIAKFERLVV